MSEFRDTRNLYLSAIPSNFQFPLTYEAWLSADDEYKAVLLFVNFFNQIELAWYKERYSYVLEVEAVETVVEYLIKNVDKIKADPKRFTPGYIYRVSSNCIYCLHEPQAAIDRNNLEVSNEVNTGDDVVNLFDLAPSEDDTYEVKQAKEAIWAIIDRMDPKARKVINQLINPDDSLAAGRNKNIGDSLADVSVSQAEVPQIIERIRAELAPFVDYFLPVSEATECNSARDKFVTEINALRETMRNTTSEKDRKACSKAINNMRKELAAYDMLQAGYTA